jgi:hypothetical protein
VALIEAHDVTESPLVSIGVPVYNGERYLRLALESLVTQDYPNLEVIISDNASTDQTSEICREYARRDSRVVYHPAEKNMGVIWNFNRVFELSHGKYFLWAAFDDLRDSDYVSSCVGALEKQPDAVLCSTDIHFIDEYGETMELPAWEYGVRPTGRSAWERVMKVARSHVAYDIYAMTRRSALQQVRRSVLTWGFDFVVLLELCLRGPVAYVAEPLFSYRQFKVKTQQGIAVLLTGSPQQGQVPVCWSCMTLELLRSIWLAPAGWAKKVLYSAGFMINFCLLNVMVAAGIRTDVTQTIKRAAAQKAWGRLAVLLAIGALVYPVHNRVTRGAFRLVKRVLGGSSRRDAGKTYAERSETGS